MRVELIGTVVSLAAMALALGACGGGGSGGTVVAAPATPTAPTPPAPPPPPTYSTYAGLTGTQSLATAYSGIRLGNMPGFIGVHSIIPAVAFGSSIALAYNAAGPSYSPSGNGVNEDFNASDIDPALSTAVFTTYVKRSATGSTTSRFAVSQHFSAATNVSMAYVRAFEWYNINDPAGPRTNYLIAGVPTLPTDLPATGTGEFGLTSVRGSSYTATTFGSPNISIRNLSPSRANCVIDFATGAVRLQMVLIGAGTPEVGFGNYVGTGTRVAGTNRFSGTFTGVGGSLNGSFHGAFFGPQAAECAIAFTFTGTFNGAPAVIAGTQAGARGPNSQLLP